ncbi:IclR family transcriptional regulator [Salinisphaera sp. RV14]|uniref:IclR family transcriptional regulator n=1 Tax=Salinisphaera sp. RV14 TaxID=3454140 RepID=UPI003F861B38
MAFDDTLSPPEAAVVPDRLSTTIVPLFGTLFQIKLAAQREAVKVLSNAPDANTMSLFHKAISLLDLIAESTAVPPRFTDLLNRSGHPRATLHRLLRALAAERLITFDKSTQTYRPGLRLLELAHESWLSSDLRSVASADVDWLAEQTGETVHLAAFDGDTMVYIDKRDSSSALRLYSAVGKRGPLYCTGIGKAILASLKPERLDELLDTQELIGHTAHTITDRKALQTELDAIREQGCAYDMEEHEPGVRCVAAAIVDRSGDVVGGVSITAPSMRMAPRLMESIAPLVIAAAGRIANRYSLLH